MRQILFIAIATSLGCSNNVEVIGQRIPDQTNNEPNKQAHPWPMFHGNGGHTGYAPVQGPQSAKVRWKLQIVATPDNHADIGSVAIAGDGTIYVGGQGKLIALDSSANKKWEILSTSSSLKGPALTAAGALYYLSENSVVSVDSASTKKWQYDTAGRTNLFGPTLGADGTLYQGSWDHSFYALNPDGTLKWKAQAAGCVSYPATVDDSRKMVYLGGGDAHCGPDGTLYAFANDGTLKWKYDAGSMDVGSPAIGADGTIYAPAPPKLLALNPDGTLKWSVGDFQNEVAGVISPAIAADGTIYVGSARGHISAIDPVTHAIKWFYLTGPEPGDPAQFRGVQGYPVVDQDGTVYVGAVDHNMYAIDKAGKLKWSLLVDGRPSESSPALGPDGTLYFTAADGYLYAIHD